MAVTEHWGDGRAEAQAGRVRAGLDLLAPRLSHRPKAGGGVWLRASL